MRLVVTVVLAILITIGCGPLAPDWIVRGPDGLEYRLIECRHIAHCMERADELCQRGWVDKYEGKNPRAIMIRCKSASHGQRLAAFPED